jgi:aldose 1-epimerase
MSAVPPTPPSGRQFEIAFGEQRATIVEVGAGIREYTQGGRAILEPYPAQAICDGGHGAPLIPWPNRLAEGRYAFDGAEYQLDLSEPAAGNAIHGLMRWRPWIAAVIEPRRVVMAGQLHPSPGYPFALALQIAYELGHDGLTVSTTATNTGAGACPYGAGQHPYLSPGEGTIDDCILQLAAATRLLIDEQHGVPIGREPVAGGELDFASARAIGGDRIDAALTDLARGPSGSALARLWGTDGLCVELWADTHHPFLQVFTGDTLAPPRRRRGLAVEPMTCASNAFRSGDGLIRLEPGESLTTVWGVRLTRIPPPPG